MTDTASMSISLPISRGFADVEAIYEQLELAWGNPNCSISTILVCASHGIPLSAELQLHVYIRADSTL